MIVSRVVFFADVLKEVVTRAQLELMGESS